mmetsp:Transcript_10011/g.14992  ORF Transcript_10011/g.14992 Transcript_10011/m.14992 type:complete len:470 (-) Transcript_10011:147-1556(-)
MKKFRSLDKAVLEDYKCGDGSSSPAPLGSMLRVSKIVYYFSTIRDFVNKYDEELHKDEEVQQSKSSDRHKHKKFVKFVNTTNVITRHCNDNERHLKSTLIKKPILLSEILTFLRENRNFIQECTDLFSDDYVLRPLEDQLKSPDDFPKLNMEDDFEMLLERKFDADVVEFDDEFDNNELLFAIVVNRTEKRIICVFRGSVSGGKDWSTNTKVFRTKVGDIKDADKDLGLKEFGNMGLHRGFANYLFSDEWTKDGLPSKFEQIVETLREIRTKRDRNGNRYKDYSIFVTGHSLGGALSQLLSFALAGSTLTRDEFPKPVTAITFASPRVGNRDWLREYQSLEKKGHLRHIRVSNDGDRVCVVPTFPIGYLQTGVNVHLYSNKKADVDYNKQRSRFSAIQCSNPLTMHGLDSYYERLVGNERNQRIMKYSVEKFYKKYATEKITENVDEYDVYGFKEADHTAELYRDFLSS